MSLFIIIFGILWLIEGVTSLLWSKQFKMMLDSTLPEMPIKGMGLLMGIMGLFILYGSQSCHIRKPVIVVGSIIFINGSVLIFLSEKLIKIYIKWWIRCIPVWFYKIWGVVMLGLGTLFLFCR